MIRVAITEDCLMASAYTNQQIADLLSISLPTVEVHRYNLVQKLAIKNTAVRS